jgi:hypothetical protein
MLRVRTGKLFKKLSIGTTYDIWCITRRCVKRRRERETRLSRSKGERPVLLARGLCAVTVASCTARLATGYLRGAVLCRTVQSIADECQGNWEVSVTKGSVY